MSFKCDLGVCQPRKSLWMSSSRIPQVLRDSCEAVDLEEDTYGVVKRIHVFREWIESFREEIGGGELSILDFGCGTGQWVTIPLARGGDRVHGVDSHEPSIRQARSIRGHEGIRFESLSLEDLVAREEIYHIVICSEVLEHMQDPEGCLRSLSSIVMPGGRVFITVPNGFGSFENLRRLEKVLRCLGIGHVLDFMIWLARFLKWKLIRRKGRPPWTGKPITEARAAGYMNFDSGHVQFFRLENLMALFEESGLTLEEARGRTLLCGPYVDWMLALLNFRGWIFRVNNDMADEVPLRWSADWMFRLRKQNHR